MEAEINPQSPILILGSRSDMALESAKIWAKRGENLILAARNLREVKKDAKDLELRYGIKVEAITFETTKLKVFQAYYQKLKVKPKGILLAFGETGDPKNDHHSLERVEAIIENNYLGAVRVLSYLSLDFIHRKKKNPQEKLFIAGISSVAGDRGRASNYLYGSAKAGLTAYLSGLRAELSSLDIPVTTIKPGFVRTKMTENLKLIEALTISAPKAATLIISAIERQKEVAYLDFKWAFVMLIIKHLPERIFKKLKF